MIYAVRRFNFLRQIVNHPVRNVLDAVGTEQIEGLVGFGEARAFPGAWLASGEGGDGIYGSTNRVGLVIKLMRRSLNEAVTHELKAGIARRRGHPGIRIENVAIDRERGRYVALRESLELPPEAGPHAVLVPTPVRYVRKQRLSHRRR